MEPEAFWELVDDQDTCAKHMRVALGAFLQAELPFGAAWTRALNSLPRLKRNEEIELLRWARPAYQAAYERGDYGVVSRPAGSDDWGPGERAHGERLEPGAAAGDECLLAFVGAAIGAGTAGDVELDAIVDPDGDAMSGSEPQAAESGPTPAKPAKRPSAARSGRSAA